MQVLITVRNGGYLIYQGNHDIKPLTSGQLIMDPGHRIRAIRLFYSEPYTLTLDIHVTRNTGARYVSGLPLVIEKGDRNNGIPKSNPA